jgi:hypothetical protein
MPSITSWMRLEPRSRNVEMNTSLQARIYDPLWLLTRQWQLGEFEGQDNGSPIVARWRAEGARLTRYYSGANAPDGVNSQSYDGTRMPLETLVERERIRPATDQSTKPERLRLAAEAGQHFLRILSQQPLSRNYRDAFIRQYSFPALTSDERSTLDSDSLRFFSLMATRVPDGRRLSAAFRSTGAIVFAPALQIAPTDLATIEKTARLWLQWFERCYSEPEATNASWSPERMEYAFSVGARFSDGERVLTADEYFEGHLDWSAFDVNTGASIGATDNASAEVTCTVIPAPVSFRGMPAPRFWEFEDAQVDFGSVDAGPTDLARMLLVDFALTYGNDWFVIPIEIEVGCLYRTRSLVITDTFGVRTIIKPHGESTSNTESGSPKSSWRMFRLSQWRGSEAPGSGLPGNDLTIPASNLFFLPPSLLKRLESRPIEEVLFLRDEMANLAWGIERVVESPAGQPLNRFEAYLEQKRRREPESPSPSSASGALAYRLTSEIPDYWVPLLPVRTNKGLRLRRGVMLNTDGVPKPVHGLGSILEPALELSLFEEEVPREGIRVTRSYQFTRWIDGSSHFWVGRRKGVGGGEGSSGLRFDSLDGN